MHADLLVFLAAAWLGPALASGPRTLLDPAQRFAALSLVAAGVAATMAQPAGLALAGTALATAAVLVTFGLALSRGGRRSGLRNLAIAGLAGVFAVVARAVFDQQSPGSALAAVALPGALTLMLVPAIAALEQRLLEHEGTPLPGLGLRRTLATGILALALAPLLAILPGPPG